MRTGLALAAICVLALTRAAAAQNGETYSDGPRGEVRLPGGATSFADAVAAYDVGDPAPDSGGAEPAAATGPPDWENAGDGNAVSLGCGGSIALEFVDNALIDTDGPDLYVFELGGEVETMTVAVSKDGDSWRRVGEVSGERAAVDLADHADPEESFRYVRLIDRETACTGRWPGADVDAVAAIGSAERVVLEGAALFSLDSAKLREGAKATLDELAASVDASQTQRMTIVGHTDGSGGASYNAELSSKRASAVRDYLAQQAGLTDLDMRVRGAGEAEPIASNASEASRAQNRRVEIILRARR